MKLTEEELLIFQEEGGDILGLFALWFEECEREKKTTTNERDNHDSIH